MESRSPPSEAGPAEEEGRSAQKRRLIVEAATHVFLQNGYSGTSMDEIAARAGVSKQTVYKQFADKERLFTEIVLGTIDQVGEPFFGGIGTLDDSEDLEPDLRELARQLVGIVEAATSTSRPSGRGAGTRIGTWARSTRTSRRPPASTCTRGIRSSAIPPRCSSSPG